MARAGANPVSVLSRQIADNTPPLLPRLIADNPPSLLRPSPLGERVDRAGVFFSRSGPGEGVPVKLVARVAAIRACGIAAS